MIETRRVVGGMLLLTVIGLVGFVPPVVTLFNQDASFLGVPQIVVYLFGAWLLLIVGTVLLTRHLPPEGNGGQDEGEG
ncbi:hypothetical protein [Devosia chinhatensis]|uniref:Uncharacterized protein n=1 Tax=Devosia chinhatensis TaxID=429727 RepID=A0A0F5FNB2_9HYPH|nr:hypothetical protein [Devosia chinhatensis]KKB09677.1 hypothetical protein VE26_07350 [Devosia chinhatensis]